jgi:hypothetical protein
MPAMPKMRFIQEDGEWELIPFGAAVAGRGAMYIEISFDELHAYIERSGDGGVHALNYIFENLRCRLFEGGAIRIVL